MLGIVIAVGIDDGKPRTGGAVARGRLAVVGVDGDVGPIGGVVGGVTVTDPAAEADGFGAERCPCAATPIAIAPPVTSSNAIAVAA